VGLGSDMDGGFSAARLPQGIDLPSHLYVLGDALAAAPFRWPDADIVAFASGNFSRLFRLA
jgi:microsomal dipeptidase-like Zn-dependent dipeptidase